MQNRPVPRCISIPFLILALCPLTAMAGGFYKWVDQEGTVHVTDNLSQVPPEYRRQLDNTESARFTSASQPSFPLEGSAEGSTRLKHVTVPYQAFEGTSRRIIITAILNGSVESRLLLDTGSPGLMISPDLAKKLGLPDEENNGLMVTAAGIGGSTKAVLAVVDSLRVGEASAEFLPATIAKVPSEEFEGLVGMDFMANYKVGIDMKNSLLILDELPPSTDRPGGHDEAWWRSTFRKFNGMRDQWARYIEAPGAETLTSSERERRLKIVDSQHAAADDLCRRLERYARDNAVPVDWRR